MILTIIGLIIALPIIIGVVLGFGQLFVGYLLYISPYIIPAIILYGAFALLSQLIGGFSNRDQNISNSNYPSSTIYPYNWDEIREQALSRDGYKCGNCESSYNLHVHHIVPLSKGGTNNLSNLQTLCQDCHKKIHPHM